MLAVGLAVVATIAPAWAGHHIDWSSVDSGEIRYEDNTRYDGALAHGVNTWNNISGVYFAPDDAFSIADVKLYDITGACSAPWVGQTAQRTGADPLELNVCLMDQSTTNERYHVVTHEFGHNLGLGDHDGQVYADKMMYGFKTGRLTLHQHDIDDYVARGW